MKNHFGSKNATNLFRSVGCLRIKMKNDFGSENATNIIYKRWLYAKDVAEDRNEK